MKVTVNSQVLKKALNHCLSCVESNTMLPICDHVMFRLGEQSCIRVTDVKSFIEYNVPLEYDEQGEFLISHVELSKYLKFLPDCPIAIEHDPKKKISKVTALEDVVVISGEDPKSFPMPSLDLSSASKIQGHKVAIDMDVDLLEKAINMTAPFVKKEADFTAINHLGFDFTGEDLKITGTNSHWASRYIIPAKTDPHAACIGPEIKKVLGIVEGEKVSLKIYQLKYWISTDQFNFVGSLFDGKFPEMDMYFKAWKGSVNVNKAELVTALSKALLFTNHFSKIIKLSFNGELCLSGEDRDYDRSYQTKMPYESDGIEELIIGCNADMLLRMLTLVNDEDIDLYLEAPMKHFFVGTSDTNHTMLLLPCHLP